MNGGLNIVKGGGVILSLLLAYRFLSNIEKRLQQRILGEIQGNYLMAKNGMTPACRELNEESARLQGMLEAQDNGHRDLQKAEEELEKAKSAVQRKEIQLRWQYAYNDYNERHQKQAQQNSQETQLTDNASATFTETELSKNFDDSLKIYQKRKSPGNYARFAAAARMLLSKIYDATEADLSQKVNDSLAAYKENQTETTLGALKDAIRQYVVYVPGKQDECQGNNILIYCSYIEEKYDEIINYITNGIASKEESAWDEEIDYKIHIDENILYSLEATVMYLERRKGALVEFHARQKRYQDLQAEEQRLKPVYDQLLSQIEEMGNSQGETEQCVSKAKETQANLRILLSAIVAKEHELAKFCAAKIISCAEKIYTLIPNTMNRRYIDKIENIIMAPTTPTRVKWALLMVFGLLGAKPVLDMVSPVSNYAKSIVCGFTAYRNKRATDTPSITAVSKRLQP